MQSGNSDIGTSWRFSIMASEIKVDTIVNAGGDNDTGIDLATNDQILLKVANATKLTMNSSNIKDS